MEKIGDRTTLGPLARKIRANDWTYTETASGLMS
jgi:hypothetical protein